MTSVMTRPIKALDLGPLTRAPLKLALAQARTAPMLALERPETVERLAAALSWEVVERQSNVELAVRLGPAGIEQQRGGPESVWVLAAPSEQFRAVLSPSSVAVQCERYSHWSDFQEALEAVLEAVSEIAGPTRVTRFGMRYVNELSDPRLNGEDPAALTAVLGEELVALAVALERPVAASLTELRVREPFGELTVRHGMTQPGRYLLDLDAYDETPGRFEVKRLMASAEAFHARIEELFAWALEPSYLASLSEPTEDQS